MSQLFFDSVAPVALAIASQTTMLPEVLIAQFADETGFHAEGVWQGKEGWSGKFNLAGISPNGKIADYASYAEFGAAYVKTISTKGYGYPVVLAQRNISAQCTALGKSSWAGTRYDADKTGEPGKDLIGIYNRYRVEIESALTKARADLLTGNGIEVGSVEDHLNAAIAELGKAWHLDSAGRDEYHGLAEQIREYAKERGFQTN